MTMKHINLTFLLTVFMSMLANLASAYDAEIDGVYYNFSDTEAAVTYLSSDYLSNQNAYSGSVVIPKIVYYNSKSYKVTSIGEHAFQGCDGLTSIDIPNSVTIL